jgi:carboxynorspermidine decarboxylase
VSSATPPVPTSQVIEAEGIRLDLAPIPTPCFVTDLAALERNAQTLTRVRRESGARIILALKGFGQFSTFPLLRQYLVGTTASGLHEALLGRDEFGGEVHVYSPAFGDAELRELLPFAHHLSFNSVGQWRHFRPQVLAAAQRRGGHPSPGLRVNPEHREVEVALYDPCAPGSRLGVTAEQLTEGDLEGLEGLHFHTLCELNSDALERTLAVVEAKFGKYLARLKWINFGGGHHITRPDYDIPRLVRVIQGFRGRYPHLQVYLEPGEAVALNTGVLVAAVLDIVHNQLPIAILDTSATAHMPDVLEMPYRPRIHGGAEPGVKAHTYRLGGTTCLAGDVIGDWSFDRPLAIGDKLVFMDMAHYTMVKTTTFNGIPLPSIAISDSRNGAFRVVKRFGYSDYRNRLS